MMGSSCNPFGLDHVERASKNAAEGLKAAGKGLEELAKVDPVGLRHLLDRNENLRLEVAALSKRLGAEGNFAGVLEVSPRQRVYLQVAGYRGEMTLDAWVDNETNWFLQNKTAQLNEASPTLPGGLASNMVEAAAAKAARDSGNLWEDWGRDLTCHPVGSDVTAARRFILRMASLRGEIDAAYVSTANQALKDFLKNPYVIPSADIKGDHAIDKRLQLVAGQHTVYLRVTPRKLDSLGDWSLEIRVITKVDDVERDQISSITVNRRNARLFNGQAVPLGMASAPIDVGSFYVQIGQGQ